MNILNIIKKKVKPSIMTNYSRVPKHFHNLNEIDFSPVFLIGGNRTGTSMTSAIFSQHPQLEGLFDLPKYKVKKIEITNHTSGYCSSGQLWQSLNKDRIDWNSEKNEGVLWGHPKHISKFYKDQPESDNQSLFLANEIQFHRKTDNIPFINFHFNMFRIGLIVKIFPNAKFIMTIRNYKDYITSCSHKWSKQGRSLEYPKIGLHWLVLNSTCLYDLNKYADGKFCIVDNASLYSDRDSVNKMLNEKLEEIELKPFDFDLSFIDPKKRYHSKEHIHLFNYNDFFRHINDLLSFEINSVK